MDIVMDIAEALLMIIFFVLIPIIFVWIVLSIKILIDGSIHKDAIAYRVMTWYLSESMRPRKINFCSIPKNLITSIIMAIAAFAGYTIGNVFLVTFMASRFTLDLNSQTMIHPLIMRGHRAWWLSVILIVIFSGIAVYGFNDQSGVLIQYMTSSVEDEFGSIANSLWQAKFSIFYFLVALLCGAGLVITLFSFDIFDEMSESVVEIVSSIRDQYCIVRPVKGYDKTT